MNNRTIHHLSHTDLDGYSCQLVMKYTPYDIINYNANYGAEVKQTLELILENITKNSSSSTIFITDLNLTMEEAKWLDLEVSKLNDTKKDIKLILLDHHSSGEDCAKKFDWYFLDTSRSATKITYDYSKENFTLNEPTWMEQYVNIVNAVDLWKMQEVENFEYGKVCMRLISEAKELNKIMFPTQDNNYKVSLLQEATRFMNNENAPIALDDNIHFLKKNFFKKTLNNTLDNLSTEYIVQLLGQSRDEKTIYYKGYKGYLSYGVGNTSIIGNGFLLTYTNYDFILDVSYKGTLSFRANNGVNVATISKEWCGGGGHPNAAGGRILGFKEQFRYDKVKEQIEKIINEKESIAGELEYKKDF